MVLGLNKPIFAVDILVTRPIEEKIHVLANESFFLVAFAGTGEEVLTA